MLTSSKPKDNQTETFVWISYRLLLPTLTLACRGSLPLDPLTCLLYSLCLLMLWPAEFQDWEITVSFSDPLSSLPTPIQFVTNCSSVLQHACRLLSIHAALVLVTSDLDCSQSRLFVAFFQAVIHIHDWIPFSWDITSCNDNKTSNISGFSLYRRKVNILYLVKKDPHALVLILLVHNTLNVSLLISHLSSNTVCQVTDALLCTGCSPFPEPHPPARLMSPDVCFPLTQIPTLNLSHLHSPK